MNDYLEKAARAFCEEANGYQECKRILNQLDQIIQFHLEDNNKFYLKVEKGSISYAMGEAIPGGKDRPELVNFHTKSRTAIRLLTGETAFWEAFVPISAENILVLGESWMYKKGVVNWFGRLLRTCRESRAERAAIMSF